MSQDRCEYCGQEERYGHNAICVMNDVQELKAENERLRAALESLTKDPPRSLPREPDEDWEVIIKMRAIAREALDNQQSWKDAEGTK